MKRNKQYFEFFDSGREIKLYNSLSGVERVEVDGNVISKQWGFSKSSHNFVVGADRYELKVSVNSPFSGNAVSQLIKNGNHLCSSELVAKPSKFMSFIAFILILVMSLVVGYFSRQMGWGGFVSVMLAIFGMVVILILIPKEYVQKNS